MVRAAVNGSSYKGMLNIGYRPTVSEQKSAQIEVHLLDFSGDIYGECMEVFFLHRLRDEIKFNSKEELMAQLQRDRVETMKYELR